MVHRLALILLLLTAKIYQEKKCASVEKEQPSSRTTLLIFDKADLESNII